MSEPLHIQVKATKRQRAFINAQADEVLFGGAAGGGKSYGQLLDTLLYAAKYPGSKQILFRRTYPELENSLIMQHLDMFPPRPLYEYNVSRHVGTLVNGSKVFFGYSENEKDVRRYQSAEFDVIRFDELTHFTEFQYIYMLSRLRGTKPYPRSIKSSTNPGGIGHAWVKQRFIAGAEPNVVRRVETRGGTMTRVFLPSRLTDNPALLQSDPDYIDRLRALPEKEYKALLLGEWDIYEGQVFAEWRNDPEHYADGAWTHVIRPFPIPKHWRIWRGFDFGYAKPFSVGWFVATPDGKCYRIHEWYGCTGEPDVGLKLTPQQIAKEIHAIEQNHELLRGRKVVGVADPAIFSHSTGDSVANMMSAHPNYVLFSPGDNNRLAGKMQMHYRLAFDQNGDCGLQVFDTCKDFIRTVPALVYSATNPEDVDTTQEDHAYDECRYVLMANPISPRETKPVPLRPQDDPLDLIKELEEAKRKSRRK